MDLVIRHQGLAIFAELKLGQVAKITEDGYFIFTSDSQTPADSQIAALKYQYQQSDIYRFYERNIAMTSMRKSIKNGVS